MRRCWRVFAAASMVFGLLALPPRSHATSCTTQAELLAPYAQRYFEVLPEIWSASGGHLRVARCAALFPVTAASQELVDRIDAFLAAGEREPGLVRVLIERRDQVLRALRSRAL